MIKRHGVARRLIHGLLALGLILAPVLSSSAAPASDETAYAVHQSADVAHASMQHADHGKIAKAGDAADNKVSSCDQHDRCSGNCCATCAQCFTATSVMSAMFLTTRSPRLSAVPRLHDRLVVAAHNRPPAV